MADLEKVIKGLECCLRESEHIDDNPCKDCPYYDVDSGIGGRCMEEKDKDAIELLKEQPHWISVEERLPKSVANRVIVYIQHEDYRPQIGYGHYEKFKGEEMWYDLERNVQFSKYGYTVTHWMPMPKPPKVSETNNEQG